MMQKIRDNLWRGWGILALLYMVSWWMVLFMWYIPFSAKALQVNVPYYEAVAAFLFVTGGLLGMIFSYFIMRACFSQ